jgi:hypothetical protein
MQRLLFCMDYMGKDIFVINLIGYYGQCEALVSSAECECVTTMKREGGYPQKLFPCGVFCSVAPHPARLKLPARQH